MEAVKFKCKVHTVRKKTKKHSFKSLVLVVAFMNGGSSASSTC